MKKLLTLTALSAALVTSFPATAAERTKPRAAAKTTKDAAPAKAAAEGKNAKPAAKPAKPPSDMFDALSALGTELKGAMGSSKGNPIPYLDKLVAHQYSDETKQKLTKVFGNTEPFTLKRSAATDGTLSYTLNAPAHNYLDSNATTIAWSELGLSLVTDKAGMTMASQGSWSSFSVADNKMSMTVSDMSLEGKQNRTTQNIWLGKLNFGIGKIAVAPVEGPGMVMEGLSFSSNAVQKGTAVDISYESQIKAIKVAGEQVDDMRFAMRMLNIDMRALEKMTDSLAEADKAGNTKEQNLAAAMEQFKVLGKSIAARGTTLEIDDLSLGYRANRAVINGKVSLLPGSDADFATSAKIAGKIVARVQVKVPVAMVIDIAKVVMTKQAEGKGEKVSPEGIAQTAQSVADVVVGKMLNGGYAKLEDGVLVSLIEFKAGKLSFNGKEVVLPKSPAKPAVAADTAKADTASDK